MISPPLPPDLSLRDLEDLFSLYAGLCRELRESAQDKPAPPAFQGFAREIYATIADMGLIGSLEVMH